MVANENQGVSKWNLSRNAQCDGHKPHKVLVRLKNAPL